MKKLAILTLTFATLGLATAQAQPVQYTQEQLDQMPRYGDIEQQRQPSRHCLRHQPRKFAKLFLLCKMMA